MLFQAVATKIVQNAAEICLRYAKEDIIRASARMDSMRHMRRSISKAPFSCLQVSRRHQTVKQALLFDSLTESVSRIGVSPAKAAVATDAVTTAYHGITRRAEVKKHETVFLFGLGGLGMNALQVVLNIGARVVVSDTRQACLDRAVSLGVPLEDTVSPSVPAQDFVRDRGLVNRIDTVLDFVGKHQTFEDAQQISKVTIQSINLYAHRCRSDLCVSTPRWQNSLHRQP